MNFLGILSIHNLVEHHLNNFHVGVVNPGDTSFVEMDMSSFSCEHLQLLEACA
jgi:hypothetical protein